MARLTAEQWEQARAEYEVRGVSLGDIAKRFAVATSSVSRKARAEGWAQGKMQDLAERKIAAVKALAEVETQTQNLPLRFRHTLQSVVQERLQAEGMLASFDAALMTRGLEILKKAENPEQWETMTRGRRNLSPRQSRTEPGTTVNVTQQAMQAQALNPRDALAEIVRQAAGTAEEVTTGETGVAADD